MSYSSLRNLWVSQLPSDKPEDVPNADNIRTEIYFQFSTL